MLVEHLGETVDIEPRQAALEPSLIRALRRWGPTRQRDLWYRSSAQLRTDEEYQRALDRLVEKGIITRHSTNRVNSFILRLARDKRKREKAIGRQVKGAA
jgi:hypothetical protein